MRCILVKWLIWFGMSYISILYIHLVGKSNFIINWQKLPKPNPYFIQKRHRERRPPSPDLGQKFRNGFHFNVCRTENWPSWQMSTIRGIHSGYTLWHIARINWRYVYQSYGYMPPLVTRVIEFLIVSRYTFHKVRISYWIETPCMHRCFLGQWSNSWRLVI